MPGDCIAVAQFRPNGICVYPEFENGGNRQATFHARTGDLNDQKKRRFRKYARLLLYLSNVKINILPDGREMKWRLNFVTLTLPGVIDPPGIFYPKGDQLEKAVALCFQKLRKSGFRHYVWRKERQPGTGNLHWHLIGNRWLDMHELNRKWNDSLCRHCPGMMERVVKKFKTYYMPQSTHVRAVHSIRGAMYDLEKYCQMASGDVTGNTFGVSHSLSKIPMLTVEANHPGLERVLAIGERYDTEWASTYTLQNWVLLRSLNSDLRQQFQTWKEANTLA